MSWAARQERACCNVASRRSRTKQCAIAEIGEIGHTLCLIHSEIPKVVHGATTPEANCEGGILVLSKQSEAVREAVGVFNAAETLQEAIDELLSSGFRPR